MTDDLLARARLTGAPLVDGNTVTFVWQGKDAPALMGDFNDWDDENLIPLEKVASGVWARAAPAVIVRIKKGRMVTGIVNATWQVYLGFVLLWRFGPGLRTGRLEYVQLFKGTIEGAIQGAFVACQQGEALSAIGQPLSHQATFALAFGFKQCPRKS